VCLLHRLAECILLCKMDQINADPTENWHHLVQKKIGQQILHGSRCYNMMGQRGDRKYVGWKWS
jgi:hypothetical protein